MDNETRIAKLKENEYQEIFGVKKPTFEAMLTILEEEYEELHKQRSFSRAFSLGGVLKQNIAQI